MSPVRRLQSLPWLIRQTPPRAGAAGLVLVFANAVLIASLWHREGSAAVIAMTTVLDFVALSWLYHTISAAYVERIMASAAAMMDAVVTVAPDRSIVLFNPAAEAMFGHAARDVLGRPVDVLIPERLRERHRRHMAAFTRRAEASRRLGRPGEFFALRASGEEFPIDASVMQVGEGAGKLYTVIARDITRQLAAERARAEDVERLRSLAQRLMRVEEDQKRLLGRELHDQVGANLATLGLSLQLIREQADPAAIAVVAPRLEFCEDLLRQTADAVRSLLGDLRPAALDALGLLAALRQLAAGMDKSGLMRFAVEGVEPSPRLGPEASIALYRIAQEAFANAAKHSGGSLVRARLAQHRGGVTLVIVDDGRWRPPAASRPPSAGLGLATMRERAEAVGATLDMRHGEDGERHGTAVTVRLPRPATAADAGGDAA